MKTQLLLAAVLSFLPTVVPTSAQQWSFGAATGPFIFGELAERTVRAAGGGPGNVSHLKLTAKTRAGLAVDVQRDLTDRFAVRLEGTFTSAPLAVKSGSSDVGIDAGRLNVASWSAPIMMRINPHGTFRFHVGAGPAYVLYHIRRRVGAGTGIVPFRGTRSRIGGAANAGVEWWFSDRFAAEGQASYIRTSSPFERADFIAADLMHIPQPQHAHTTVALRWRF